MAAPIQSGSAGRSGRALRRAVVVAAALSLTWLPAGAGPRHEEPHWVATWGTAPVGQPLPKDLQEFDNQTLRLIVHTSIGGRQVRVRLSNEFGTAPLRIGAAHVALRAGGAGIVSGTDRVLTFGGMQEVTIAAGAPVLSDPVELDVPALADLAVSLHLPGKVQATTLHARAAQTSYVSPAGDFTGAAALPSANTIGSWPFLTEVDVAAPDGAAIVALGDSITDSAATRSDANHRWPDLLALRLQSRGGQRAGAGKHHGKLARVGGTVALGVVNRGLSGNRMLRDPGEQPLFGKAALARFDRDVLATAGVKYMVLLIGINDIGHPGGGKIPMSEEPSLEELVAGYRQLVARAHEKGIEVYGATLAPFEDNTFAGFYSPAKEATRVAVNDWIRTSGQFDAVIDFERALRDPQHPTRMLPAYDSGDHLHPNDRGTQAMADAIPLELFGGAPAEAARRRR